MDQRHYTMCLFIHTTRFLNPFILVYCTAGANIEPTKSVLSLTGVEQIPGVVYRLVLVNLTSAKPEYVNERRLLIDKWEQLIRKLIPTPLR